VGQARASTRGPRTYSGQIATDTGGPAHRSLSVAAGRRQDRPAPRPAAWPAPGPWRRPGSPLQSQPAPQPALRTAGLRKVDAGSTEGARPLGARDDREAAVGTVAGSLTGAWTRAGPAYCYGPRGLIATLCRRVIMMLTPLRNVALGDRNPEQEQSERRNAE